MGQIDFGFGCGVDARRCGCARLAAQEVGAHTFCLVKLKRTGVRFLLDDSDGIEDVKNGFTLDLQFTR
jgi:hypothetical protein